MSYRRAWLLVDDLNRCFKQPLVQTLRGGTGGGGAELSSFGLTVVETYRAMEREAATAVASRLTLLEQGLADRHQQ
jgi:molybdate transport system regulatory protein